MTTKETYRKLGSVIEKLNGHILSNKKSPYLPGVVRLHPQPVALNLTASEARLRRDSLTKFQQSPHYRVVEPSVWTTFYKNLYPMRNSMANLDMNREPFRQVNHDQLFRSYCALPHPGVAHMAYDDFEQFMQRMFSYRGFSRPNSLSGTNIHFQSDEYILKQYANAQAIRQAHLNTLWQITNDLESAKIPTSDHERRNMIYKTFFRDRQDVMNKINSIVENGHPQVADAAKAALKEWQSPDFDYETYKDVSSRFGESTDADTLNVLLLTALRHDNLDAYSDIMSKFAAESFTRNTFYILLENLARMGHLREYTKYVSMLVSRHVASVDIQLLNVIVSSLVNVDKPDLAMSLANALSANTDALTEDEQFLKMITLEDRAKYKQYIEAYNQLPTKPSVNCHPTEQTFLPLIKHYCETGASFDVILKLISRVESESSLPITSQMFKHIFRGFSLHQHFDIADLQHMLAKLIEVHDLNSGTRDTWIREQISNSALPHDLSIFLNELMTDPPKPGYATTNNKFLKLSNGLVRQVFAAYQHTLGHHSDLKEKVQAMENELNDALTMAETRHRARFMRDEPAVVDLHEREELVYLKKTTLLKLLDISP